MGLFNVKRHVSWICAPPPNLCTLCLCRAGFFSSVKKNFVLAQHTKEAFLQACLKCRCLNLIYVTTFRKWDYSLCTKSKTSFLPSWHILQQIVHFHSSTTMRVCCSLKLCCRILTRDGSVNENFKSPVV